MFPIIGRVHCVTIVSKQHSDAGGAQTIFVVQAVQRRSSTRLIRDDEAGKEIIDQFFNSHFALLSAGLLELLIISGRKKAMKSNLLKVIQFRVSC